MPTGVYKRKLTKERFEEKFAKGNGCWDWTGFKNSVGYGYFRLNGKSKLAHRVSWEIHVGEIPNGLCVLHKCDNPKCVNPLHLFLGTNQDNINDKVAKNRQSKLKGEVHGMSKLTEKQVVEIRNIVGLSQRKIATIYGVHQTLIGLILRGENWRHI